MRLNSIAQLLLRVLPVVTAIVIPAVVVSGCDELWCQNSRSHPGPHQPRPDSPSLVWKNCLLYPSLPPLPPPSWRPPVRREQHEEKVHRCDQSTVQLVIIHHLMLNTTKTYPFALQVALLTSLIVEQTDMRAPDKKDTPCSFLPLLRFKRKIKKGTLAYSPLTSSTKFNKLTILLFLWNGATLLGGNRRKGRRETQ